VHIATALAEGLRCPTVCHVHELEMSIRRFGKVKLLDRALAQVDRFVAVSRAVEENLVAAHGIDPDRIVRIPETIPIPTAPPDPARSARLRNELGIPADAFVVGGCGTADWRKGPDVFLLVAKALGAHAAGRPVHFVWVGGAPHDLRLVEHDRVRLGLTGSTTFVGALDDPSPYYGVFDAFFLSSREDPYPLVCLEAAAAGLPVVCYADAGGMPEFVESDAGVVLPYLDITATADCLTRLAADDDERRRLGTRAAAKVAERCGIDIVGPQIAAVLDLYRR
jgi:glycosyltransferase involved in cell wall biosynthesis